MTIEFRSDALTNWAIRPWVQLALRANFLQSLQFYLFVQCSRFISVFALVSRHICFNRSLAQVITLVAEWIDTYGIHHWRIFRSSYRKLAWVGFEPTTTEFRSDAPTDWAIRQWVQLALRANFAQPLQFHLFSLFSIHVSFRSLLSSVATFVSIYIYIYMYMYIYSQNHIFLSQFQFIFVPRVYWTAPTSLSFRVCWTVYSRLVRYLRKHKNFTCSRNVLIKRLIFEVIRNLLKHRFLLA